jgi:hypothetical protein
MVILNNGTFKKRIITLNIDYIKRRNCIFLRTLTIIWSIIHVLFRFPLTSVVGGLLVEEGVAGVQLHDLARRKWFVTFVAADFDHRQRTWGNWSASARIWFRATFLNCCKKSYRYISLDYNTGDPFYSWFRKQSRDRFFQER